MNRLLLAAFIISLGIAGVGCNWLLGRYVQQRMEVILVENFKERLTSEVSMLTDGVRTDLLFGNVRGVRNKLTKLSKSEVFDGFLVKRGDRIVAGEEYSGDEHFKVVVPVYFSEEKKRQWGEVIYYASTVNIKEFSDSTSLFLLKWTVAGTLSMVLILTVLFTYFWLSSKSLTQVLTRFLKEDSIGEVDRGLRVTWSPLLSALSYSSRKLKKQKDMIAESEREALIGRTVSMISHDMKGPLAVFQRVANNSEEDYESEKSNMRYALNRLLSMADSIKRADLESLIQPVALDTFSVAEIVEGCRAYAENHLTSISYDGPGAFHEISLDPVKMERALTNLIHNACETTSTEVKIVAGLENLDLIIRISDDGPGVLPVDEDKIFARGFTVGKEGGTGLGLSFVRHVAMGHGGEVKYLRESGWTVFELKFPGVISRKTAEEDSAIEEEGRPTGILVLSGNERNLAHYRKSLPEVVAIHPPGGGVDLSGYRYIFTENLDAIDPLENWQQCIFLGAGIDIETNIKKIMMFALSETPGSV